MVNMDVHVISSVLFTVRLSGVVKLMVTVNVEMVIMDWDVTRCALLTVIGDVIKTQGLVTDVSRDFMVYTATKHVL